MNFQVIYQRGQAIYAGGVSILIAVSSILHGLSLFLSSRPKTPLRVLCIMAFDALHMLRHAKPLSLIQLRLLAALLDFGACANAAFDRKAYYRHECRLTLQLLEAGGICSSVVEYLRRLRDLESRRPLPGGDYWQFQKVALYREFVVRLSLGMVATTAHGNQRLDEGIRATCCDADLKILFRIVMQCQIIDDVLDYTDDVSAGLPSFLTATGSRSQALELTAAAARSYGASGERTPGGAIFPFRITLALFTATATLVVRLAERRYRQDANLEAACRRAGT
jgi:hypothetical protein